MRAILDQLHRRTGILLTMTAVALALLAGCAKKAPEVKPEAEADYSKKAAALEKAGVQKGWMAGKGGGAKTSP